MQEQCAGSQSPDWEPGMRSSSFARREAGASVTEFSSLSLGTSEVSARYPRSHAPRGNAVPDALRPVYGVARLDRISTQSARRYTQVFK